MFFFNEEAQFKARAYIRSSDIDALVYKELKKIDLEFPVNPDFNNLVHRRFFDNIYDQLQVCLKQGKIDFINEDDLPYSKSNCLICINLFIEKTKKFNDKKNLEYNIDLKHLIQNASFEH